MKWKRKREVHPELNKTPKTLTDSEVEQKTHTSKPYKSTDKDVGVSMLVDVNKDPGPVGFFELEENRTVIHKDISKRDSESTE